MSLLDIRDVNFSYIQRNGNSEGKFSIKNFSVEIHEGEFISIIGKNGSGKSTLVKLLARVHTPDSGQIFYKDKDILSFDRKEYSRMISYLPQSVELNENIRVTDLLMLGRYSYKNFTEFTFTNEDKHVVSSAIEITSTQNISDKYVTSLSGGEKQKALITLSIVQLDITRSLDKKILIIDEPLTHLDINHQLEIFDILKRLNDKGLTILVIMHDLNLALRYSNKSMLMSGGQLVKYSNTKSVITEEMLKEHFSINTKILNFEKNFFINYLPY